MKWQPWRRITKLVLITLLLLILLAPEWPVFGSEPYGLRRIVGLRSFDFLVWETQAFLAKAEGELTDIDRYLSEAQQKALVLQYLDLIRQARQLEAEINTIYVDPTVADPASETATLQAELEALRTRIDERQLLAETIVQSQVASVLADEGFALGDDAWPPVLMRVTPLPSVLIVSPRERIERSYGFALAPGLTIPTMEDMESAVYEDLNLSGLVVPIGGLGSFPAMILETSSVYRLVEVVAHEWTHHWLTLQPLGFNYMFNDDVRIINETVASIVDQEVGPLVLEKYYPEYAPPRLPPSTTVEIAPETEGFDFNKELGATRKRVDELLAEGRVEEAETYMEARRQEFLENGYAIRKINQAFFAFYGAYADEPEGAQGGNPIGPMLRDIRARTPSVRAFLDTVAPVTSFAELEAIHSRLTGG